MVSLIFFNWVSYFYLYFICLPSDFYNFLSDSFMGISGYMTLFVSCCL